MEFIFNLVIFFGFFKFDFFSHNLAITESSLTGVVAGVPGAVRPGMMMTFPAV